MSQNKYVHLVLLAVSITCCFCSNDDDSEFTPRLSFETNKITCKFCYEFGWIIEASGNEVFVVDYEDIYIFEDDNGDFSLKQEIQHQGTSAINTLLVHDNQLLVGIAESDGTGRVDIYEKPNDQWVNVQQLRIGRSEDNFGCAIDIHGDYMVIGASAIWDGWNNGIIQNTDEGRIYVYRRSGSDWSLETEFKAQNTRPDDYFGESVAIHEDFIFAGSGSTPMHIYHKNNEWELFKVDTVSPLKIVHENNHFVIRNGYHILPEIMDFKIDQDGNYTLRDANIDFTNLYNVSSYGEMIALDGNLLLTWIEPSEEASILKYENEQWIEMNRYRPLDDLVVIFSGLEIVGSNILLGGRDTDLGYSYLYKIPI